MEMEERLALILAATVVVAVAEFVRCDRQSERERERETKRFFFLSHPSRRASRVAGVAGPRAEHISPLLSLSFSLSLSVISLLLSHSVEAEEEEEGTESFAVCR